MLTLSQNPFSGLPRPFNFLDCVTWPHLIQRGWVGWETEYLPFYHCDGILKNITISGA